MKGLVSTIDIRPQRDEIDQNSNPYTDMELTILEAEGFL